MDTDGRERYIKCKVKMPIFLWTRLYRTSAEERKASVQFVATFLLLIGNSHLVSSDTCFASQQFDPQEGRLRWAVPFQQRCSCQRILPSPSKTRLIGSAHKCPFPYLEPDTPNPWWYIDDVIPLFQRTNWFTDNLQGLLGCPTTGSASAETTTVPMATTGAMTTDEPYVATGNALVPADCLECICMKLDSGCKMPNAFGIGGAYHTDAVTHSSWAGPGLSFADCVEDWECSELTVISYMERYARLILDPPTCEQIARIHKSGYYGYHSDNVTNVPFWTDVQLCLSGASTASAETTTVPMATTGAMTTDEPYVATGNALVPADCLECICMKLDSGCKMPNAFGIGGAYHIDAVTHSSWAGPGLSFADCVEDWECSELTVISYMERYARLILDPPTCEQIARIHKSGYYGYHSDNVTNVPFWTDVQLCLSAPSTASASKTTNLVTTDMTTNAPSTVLTSTAMTTDQKTTNMATTTGVMTTPFTFTGNALVSADCLECICESLGTLCKMPNAFDVSEAFHTDAVDHTSWSGPNLNYADCVKDWRCSELTVISYMERYARMILDPPTCQQIARIHKSGYYSYTSDSINNLAFWAVVQPCLLLKGFGKK
ncbi:uncharacterized protein [Amphiura filiformis]|uniref:uncharacterized protein n=1 Tax=Amphiura filiformis TaxID=82378 RepID=UPI003B21F856